MIDIKRRATQNYVLCAAGAKELRLWTLNPYSGDFSSEPCNLGAQVHCYIHQDDSVLWTGERLD